MYPREKTMKITPLKTERITAGSISLTELLDKNLSDFPDKSVLAITSKVVSLCEGSTVPIEGTDKEALIRQQASHILPPEYSIYGRPFTITGNTLISSAGIDESNGEDQYILWPADAQATANQLRIYLCQRFNIKYAGVIITDSTSQPMRRGSIGIALAHSGFDSLQNYIGKPDLFGRPIAFSKANVASGLAAAAVVTMGEGDESTPLCLLSELSFVNFQDRDPNAEELTELTISLEEDLYEPFLKAVKWEKGQCK